MPNSTIENNQPALQQTDASSSFFCRLFPKFSKWAVFEVYYFNASWYVVQMRQNLRTGYKYFRCKKIIRWHYGHSFKNLTVDRIEALAKNWC